MNHTKRTRLVDRFGGRILGAGTSSGLRLVVGDWTRSPLGAFTDVMVATGEGRRILLAPDGEVADYVAQTYSFDDVVCGQVGLVEATAGAGRRWQVEAGPLQVRIDVGARTATGWLLKPIPGPLVRSRAFAVLADPVASRVHPGVRTRGSAGNGRREYYGAHDQHTVTELAGTWDGADLGSLAPVRPSPRFGFSSTPEGPSLTRVTTTIVREV